MTATATATNIPTAHGTPSGWKYGSRVKRRQKSAPAIVKPEATTTLRDPAVCGVVSRFPVLAGLARLLIAPGEKYRVVRSGRDHDRHQQINDVSGEANELR